MGDFAQQSLPLADSVSLVIQRVNQTKPDAITVRDELTTRDVAFSLLTNNQSLQLPYRSKINPATVPFNSSATYRANNCVAVAGTNGVDLRASAPPPSVAAKFQHAPPFSPSKKHLLNVMLNSAPRSNIALPSSLVPTAPALNGSFGVGTFYLQKDGITGVLALVSCRNDWVSVLLMGR
jgi:hypothetical protein